MKNFWLSNYKNIVVRGIIAIIAGALMVFIPDITLESFVMLIGGLVIAIGAFALIQAGQTEISKERKMFRNSEGIFNLILGGFLLFFPNLFVSIFVVLIGIFFLLLGILQLSGALGFNVPFRVAWFYYASSAFLVFAGIILLTNPFESAVAILRFLGILLMIYGTSEAIMGYRIKKAGQYDKKGNILDDFSF